MLAVISLLAPGLLLAGTVAYRELDGRRAAAAAVREAAIRGRPPRFASELWRVEETQRLDRWSRWEIAVYEPGEGVVCWRFLVSPLGTSDREAFRQSRGTSGCSRDRGDRYELKPKELACTLLGPDDRRFWHHRYRPPLPGAKPACA